MSELSDNENQNNIIEENKYNDINNINKSELNLEKEKMNIEYLKQCLMKIKNKENNEEDSEFLNKKIKLEESEENKIDNQTENEKSEEFEENEEEEDENYSINLQKDDDSDIDKSKTDENLINIYKRRQINETLKKQKTKNYNKSNAKTIQKRRKYYIHQLLQRWWYALPPWPPNNYDTSQKLEENKLRLVQKENWKKEIDINSDNYKKCVELPGYKYVYITKEGKIFDFRPEEGKPSYNNLMKLSDIDLHQYIVTALKNQLNDLEKKNYYSEVKLKNDIKNQLKIAKRNLINLKRNK